MSYPSSWQKSLVIVETCAPVSVRAVTQMLPLRMSASVTLPINSTAAFGLEDGFWRDIYWLGLSACVGTGSVFGPGAGGMSCCISPSGSLKVLHFEHSGTHYAHAPTLDNGNIEYDFYCSPSSLGLVTSGYAMIVTTALSLGTWTIDTGILTIPPLTPVEPLSLGLFGMFWAPLMAAISCCCISTHFDQGTSMGALISWSSSPARSVNTLLTMPALEAYDVLCFSCSCSPSALLAAPIKVMLSIRRLSNLACIASWSSMWSPWNKHS